MSETDTPLKQLFTGFGKELAQWLLNTPIKSARHAATELPPSKGTIRADYVLEVTLPDDSQLLLHTEFQGSSSERPVPWRMLDYNARLAEQTQFFVCSTIIYLGEGAGATDTGQHQLLCPVTGKPSIQWHYQVLHLWRLKAEQLLALNNPVLLTLIGQTEIANPAEIFPQVLASIRQQTEGQQKLLQLFIDLLNKEEWLAMVKQLVEQDPILNTPFMREKQMLRLEGKRETLSHLLEKRFNALPTWVTKKLENATAEELEQWTLRILDVDSLEQVFDLDNDS